MCARVYLSCWRLARTGETSDSVYLLLPVVSRAEENKKAGRTCAVCLSRPSPRVTAVPSANRNAARSTRSRIFARAPDPSKMCTRRNKIAWLVRSHQPCIHTDNATASALHARVHADYARANGRGGRPATSFFVPFGGQTRDVVPLLSRSCHTAMRVRIHWRMQYRIFG